MKKELSNTFDYINKYALRDQDFVLHVPKNSPMINFYRNKSVFLTGGTGFLGQLFVEKLLRCGVKEIYVLVRAKKGKQPKDRLAEVYSGPVFKNLEKISPNYMERIKPIEGDMQQLLVGISEQDISEICENVQIVLHSAAEVRFDEALKQLLLVNLRGTREILKLSEQIKNLEVFIHISTAYSHCPRQHIEERFYEPPMDYELMIKVAEKLSADGETDQQIFEIVTDQIIAPWPNTYTYTKALTEELVRTYGKTLPICVIRPSIIIATHEDPIPGWCNNVYGLTGVLISTGMGFQRILPYKTHLIGDIVCADFVINSALAAGWVTYIDRCDDKTKPLPEPKVYNVTSYRDCPTTYGEIAAASKIAFHEIPSEKILWIPKYNVTDYAILEFIYIVFYHILPAIFFDLIFKLLGNPLRLMPMYRKVHRFMKASTYFMTHEWKFDNKQMRSVLDRMSPEDQSFFPSDIKKFDFNKYAFVYYLGMRAYIVKEIVFDLDKAKFKVKCLKIAHTFVVLIYYIGLAFGIYLILKYFGLTNLKFLTFVQ